MKKNKKLTISSIDDIIENTEDYVLIKPHVYAKTNKRNDLFTNIAAFLIVGIILFSVSKIYYSIFPENVMKVGDITVTKSEYEDIVGKVLLPVKQEVMESNGIPFNADEYNYYSSENLDWFAYMLELGLKAKEMNYELNEDRYFEEQELYGKYSEYFILANKLRDEVNDSYTEPTEKDYKKMYEATKELIYIDTENSKLSMNIYTLENLSDIEMAKKDNLGEKTELTYEEFIRKYNVNIVPGEDAYIENVGGTYTYFEIMFDERNYREYEEVEEDLKYRYKHSQTDGILDDYVQEMKEKHPIKIY